MKNKKYIKETLEKRGSRSTDTSVHFAVVFLVVFLFLKKITGLSDNLERVSNFLKVAQLDSDPGLIDPKEGEIGWCKWLWRENT